MSYQRRSTYSSKPIKSVNVMRKERASSFAKKLLLFSCSIILTSVFLKSQSSAFAKRLSDEKNDFQIKEAVAVFSENCEIAKSTEEKTNETDGHMSMEEIEEAAQRYIEEHRPSYVFPLDGYITSLFADRIDPITLNGEEFHLGIDISAATDVEISAYADGVVKRTVISDEGYGIHLIIEHDGFETLYGHCSELLVVEGDTVKAGDVIAIAGSTGRSTGTHLHFEIRINGVQVDPLIHMESNGVKRYA